MKSEPWRTLARAVETENKRESFGYAHHTCQLQRKGRRYAEKMNPGKKRSNKENLVQNGSSHFIVGYMIFLLSQRIWGVRRREIDIYKAVNPTDGYNDRPGFRFPDSSGWIQILWDSGKGNVVLRYGTNMHG